MEQQKILSSENLFEQKSSLSYIIHENKNKQ
jgi:hypothetical protein